MSDIFLSESGNLSTAWANMFIKLSERGVTELSPVIVRITEFDKGLPIENPLIREKLDATLRRKQKRECHEVSSTIFPISLWNRKNRNPRHVFERFEAIWPRVQKRDRANQR